MHWGVMFLYILQSLRLSCGSIFDDFMLFITNTAGLMPCFLVLALVYWCINKDLGSAILLNLSFGTNINYLLKNHFKIPRPWLRDPRIVPVSAAIDDAAGYSLPSAHVARAMATYGVIAADLSKREKKKEFSVQQVIGFFLWTVVVLIMFSRMYLGVHTHTDVLVAFGLGLLWMLILRFALLLQKNEIILVAGLAVTIYSIYHYGLNSNVGILIGLLFGWYVEQRWIRFQTDGTPQEKMLRFIIGGSFLILLFTLLPKFITVFTLARYANFVTHLIAGLYITVAFPLCFHSVQTGKINLQRLFMVHTSFLLVMVITLSTFGYYWTRNPRLLAEEDADRLKNAATVSSEETTPSGEINTVDFSEKAMTIIAAGGYAAQYPSNSNGAFQSALEMGATSLRCDVQMTKDGQLVLYKETTFTDDENVMHRIGEFTYDELRRFSFDGVHLMKFSQFLNLVSGQDVTLYVNLVDVGSGRRDEFTQMVYNEIANNKLQKSTTFVSTNYGYLESIRALNNKQTILYETSSGTADLLSAYPADAYSIFADNISSELVHAMHEAKAKIYAYDVSGPTQILNIYRMGTDGVFAENYGLASVVSHPEYSLLCDNYDASYAMPGLYGEYVPRLCEDMICQGMAKTSEHLIISAYSYSGKYNSILYVMDLEGNLVKIIDLGFQAHVGGLAYDETHDVLWVTARLGYVYALDWHKLRAEVEKEDPYNVIYRHDGSYIASFDAGLINHNGLKIASFLTMFEGKLYVGSYVNGGSGVLNSYEIDDNCRVSLDSSVEIPQRIQGLCFYRDVATDKVYMLMSQSHSVYDSQLLRFVYHDTTKKYKYASDYWRLPEGAEQIVMTTRGLYLLFESSAKKYRNTARLSNDQIFVIRMTD